MFSVSKSFTSLGVGLAIAENKLALTDKVVSFFPQSLPDTLSAYMQEMTVQDLLKMATGMNSDPLFNAFRSTDWPAVFLSAPVDNKPGTVFKYNNMATFMLSAIVQKATGVKLADYLKPRLFEPLGIINYTWDDAPGGYTFGAIGLRIQSEDMAKVGQLLLQKGKWKGKQLVPEAWVEEATARQIDSNDPGNTQPREMNDWQQGYGYQFWRCTHNGFRADGLGGQFIIVLPEQDAVVVLTSAANNTQEVLNLVWENLLPAMQDKALPEDKKTNAELSSRLAALTTIRTAASGTSSMINRISGKRIEVAQNEIGIRALSLSLKNKEALIQIDRGPEQYELTAGLQQWKFRETKLNTWAGGPRPTQVLPIKVASSYTWLDANTIEITSRFVEDNIRSEACILRFEETGSDLKVHIEIKVYIEFAGVKSHRLEGLIN